MLKSVNGTKIFIHCIIFPASLPSFFPMMELITCPHIHISSDMLAQRILCLPKAWISDYPQHSHRGLCHFGRGALPTFGNGIPANTLWLHLHKNVHVPQHRLHTRMPEFAWGTKTLPKELHSRHTFLGLSLTIDALVHQPWNVQSSVNDHCQLATHRQADPGS